MSFCATATRPSSVNTSCTSRIAYAACQTTTGARYARSTLILWHLCNAEITSSHEELKVVEAEDTAGSAKYIHENHCQGWAAICHADAAKMYGLKVLDNHIEDNKHNFTRFLIATDPRKADYLRPLNDVNKSSIVFTLPHSGSLSKVLTILSFYDINLTKIQSLPVIGHEWEYMFYVDVTFTDLIRYRQSIDAITPLVKSIKILGEYKEA